MENSYYESPLAEIIILKNENNFLASGDPIDNPGIGGPGEIEIE